MIDDEAAAGWYYDRLKREGARSTLGRCGCVKVWLADPDPFWMAHVRSCYQHYGPGLADEQKSPPVPEDGGEL